MSEPTSRPPETENGTDPLHAQSLETLLVHADAAPHEGSVAPPIYQGVPFAAASGEQFVTMASQPRHERFYRRDGNPTQARLEKLIATAEGAEAALATASGVGAMATTILALASAGDHIIAQRNLYAGTLSLLRDAAPRFGIDVTLVDQTDVAAFAAAINPATRLLVLETPSNPLLHLTDLEALRDLVAGRNILVIVDSTIATPVNQRPIELGADLVMHSVTKALSGHSDVLAGVVAGNAQLIERIWRFHIAFGAVISPLDAWLAVRGMRTLSMRVSWQNASALAVAHYLAQHSAVAAVNYPGLPTHAQHDLAQRQMSGFGGLLSFELRDGFAAAAQLMDRLKLPARSASLGGARSLVVQPAALWGESLSVSELTAAGVSPGLVRFAVGLEHPDDLIADLEQGLATL